MNIISALVDHAAIAYNGLPKKEQTKRQLGIVHKFYQQLPKQFSKADYENVANALDINLRTAEGYISRLLKDGLLLREKKNHYIKQVSGLKTRLRKLRKQRVTPHSPNGSTLLGVLGC